MEIAQDLYDSLCPSGKEPDTWARIRLGQLELLGVCAGREGDSGLEISHSKV